MPIAFAKGNYFKILFMTFFLTQRCLVHCDIGDIYVVIRSKWKNAGNTEVGHLSVQRKCASSRESAIHRNTAPGLCSRIFATWLAELSTVSVYSLGSLGSVPSPVWYSITLVSDMSRGLRKGGFGNHFIVKENESLVSGHLKRFNPRIVFHTNTCVLLVGCMYRCCKDHEISSCHSSVLLSFQVSYTFQLPFCLFHKSG